MRGLAGLGVLVTRPAWQAGPLSQRLTALGATVYALPALEIVPRADQDAQQTALGPIAHFDWVIFVSANAVRYGAQWLPNIAFPRLAAVGPATAAALTATDRRLDLLPVSGYDSEQLLASPAFQSVRGQRILIVRGNAGRATLADTLIARGAEVAYAEVYTRTVATPAPQRLRAIETAWAAGAIQIVTVTSVDIARALLQLLTPQGRALFTQSTLLAGSARIADRVRALGLTGPLVIAANPAEDGLIEALLTWPRPTDQPNASA